MGSASINARVQKHRDALRMAGLRPVQIWVPDTRRPGFQEECERQCKLVAKSDAVDLQLRHISDEAISDMDDWKA